MNSTTPAQVFRFGVFEVDTTSGELRRHGLKIRLAYQSVQILKVLLSRPGEVVTREELRHVLWSSGTFVDFEVGLNSAIRRLREALDDSAENPRFIETLPRHGYRFVGSVSAPELDSPLQSKSAVAEPPVTPAEAVAEEALEHAASPVQAPQASGVLPEPTVETLRRARFGRWRAGGLLLVPLVVVSSVMYQGGGSPLPPDPIRLVLVLPFENLTGDTSQDYVVDSVTEGVTTQLARVSGLDVISRTSARQYKDTVKSPQAIAQELRVDGVVAGTVVKSESGVEITVHLIRTATERDVWAQTYPGDPSHMIGLQQRIASEIAVAAGRAALPSGGTAITQAIVPQAYEAYLKGVQAQGQERYEGFRRAVAYFEEAVAIQPDFAEAHAALAVAQLQFLYDGPLSPHESIPRAEVAAQRALQLDDTLSQAHRVLGRILLLYHWRKEEGEAALDRAARLQGSGPNETTTMLANSLKRRGRFEEAIAAAQRTRRLDPLSLGAQVAVGTAYRSAGQYDRAIEELRRALEISPARPRVHFQLGVTFVAMGLFDDAIPALEIAARPVTGHIPRHEAYLGYAYAAAGRSTDARAVLKELEAHRREHYVSWFGAALIHDALGEKEPALAALQRAYQDHAVELALDHYPPFKAIAAEPEFQAVMRQVGIAR